MWFRFAWVVAIALFLPAEGRTESMQKRLYLGVGGGISLLEPETGGTDFTLIEDQDAAAKLLLGTDLGKRWSMELYYADLGAATLADSETEGELDYAVYGLSALYYWYNNHGSEGLLNRSGLQFHAKLGVGGLLNQSDLRFETQEQAHVMFALGAGYGWRNGFAVRLDAESFDSDAKMLSVSLIKRFGVARSPAFIPAEGVDVPEPAPTIESVTQAAPVLVVVAEPEPEPEPEPVPELQLADGDADGIADTLDLCPQTPPAKPVNTRGCDMLNSVLEGVVFAADSERLLAQSHAVLDELAELLLAQPGTRIAVVGHMDNTGEARHTMNLSAARAVSVARYLVSKGVVEDRLQLEAYGETRPRASNKTPAGRAANQRIEVRELNQGSTRIKSRAQIKLATGYWRNQIGSGTMASLVDTLEKGHQ